MPNGKAPGLDGFPAEFLKHFWSVLSPLFFITGTEIKTKKQSNPSPYENGSNKIVTKNRKRRYFSSNYQPLSLINTDIKVIPKALSSRLETVLPSINHNDHTGLIKGSHSANNISRLLNPISLAQHHKTEEMVMLLHSRILA